MNKIKKIESVAIIGLGNFGGLLAKQISRFCVVQLLGYDIKSTEVDTILERVSLSSAALADVIIMAVPINKFNYILTQISDIISKETLIIDICSVKMDPEKIIKNHLPDHPNMLLTHPLFGPISAASGLQGKQMIVTKQIGDRAKAVIDICCKLGLEINSMSAKQHDEIMARTQAVSFFIGACLDHFGLKDEGKFNTPSYKMLLNLADHFRANSHELFEVIQLSNPFVKESRANLLESFHEIEQHLQH